MRIAMMGHKRTASRDGGVEVVVTELATRLVAAGHEVICYDRSDTRDAPRQPWEYRGVRVVPVPTFQGRGIAALTSAHAAAKRAIADQPDLVHIHAEGPSLALPQLVRAGIPTVVTIHGIDWQRAKWGFVGRNLIRLGERRAARYTTEMIVLSRSAQQYFADTYRRSTHVIPNAIDPVYPRSIDVLSQRWGLADRKYLLSLGRLVPEKRLDLLLQAYSLLSTDYPLVIAGGDRDSAEYGRLIRDLAAKDPRVLLVGETDEETTMALFSHAAAFVLPSDLEGLPMTLLEAMAAGCRVLVSDIPELREVIPDGIPTFCAGDVEDLACQLTCLVADSSHSELLGKRTQEHVLNHFGWDRVLEATIRVYEEALR